MKFYRFIKMLKITFFIIPFGRVLSILWHRVYCYFKQGKTANALLASNTIRWVNGLAGTVVTFSEDIGLPSIFNPVPCRYINLLLNGTKFALFFLLHALDIYAVVVFLAILLHAKNVRVRIAQMHTSIGIPNQSFLSAVCTVTRQYMKRCSLWLPAKFRSILPR